VKNKKAGKEENVHGGSRSQSPKLALALPKKPRPTGIERQDAVLPSRI